MIQDFPIITVKIALSNINNLIKFLCLNNINKQILSRDSPVFSLNIHMSVYYFDTTFV